MIIEKKDLDKLIPKETNIKRFDMAICFYIIVNIDNIPHFVTYDYNPVFNSWFPFYDDKNKKAVIKRSKAKTYKELILECDSLLKINLEDKLVLAKERFKQLVGNIDIKLEKLKNFIVYEIKYSKSANLWTIYKLYNFKLLDISNINSVPESKTLKSKTFNLLDKDFENLVENAKYIISKENFKKI